MLSRHKSGAVGFSIEFRGIDSEGVVGLTKTGELTTIFTSGES